MAQSKYRKELDNYITDVALEDVGNERIAPENAHEVLNHIEDRVNAIKDKLFNIFTKIDEIYDMMNELSNDLYQKEDIIKHKHIDGVTLSGGDPFYQQEECVSLLKLLPEHLDVWIYTGFDYEEIKNTQLAQMADYIVDGKFEQDKLVTGKMYGSSNQRIIKVKEDSQDFKSLIIYISRKES